MNILLIGVNKILAALGDDDAVPVYARRDGGRASSSRHPYAEQMTAVSRVTRVASNIRMA